MRDVILEGGKVVGVCDAGGVANAFSSQHGSQYGCLYNCFCVNTLVYRFIIFKHKKNFLQVLGALQVPQETAFVL